MSRPAKIVTAVILGVVIVIAGGVVALGTLGGSRIPSDEEMLNHFSKHASEFQELLDLYQADPQLERHVTAWATKDDPYAVLTMQSNNATQKRYAELRRLLKLEKVESWSEDGMSEVELTYESYGIVSSGHIKGYLFSRSPPGPLVTSTDHPEGGDGFIYRRINDSWYLFYVWN
jgi:hypothetical protein